MFNTFSNAVRKQFDSVSEEYLFVVDAPDLWTHYLNSFPEGSNPLFRKRTEYDCACCRSFLRNIGNVVAIQNGAMVSVWDIQGLPEPFQTVANSMAEYIKSRRISDIFITKERFYGSGRTITLIEEKTHFFDHFSVVVPAQFVSKRENGEKRGFARTTRDVLYRGLTELNPVAVEDVINLIKENAIYRGAEHLETVLDFQRMQSRFATLSDDRARDAFVWNQIWKSTARFRNTVVGTLVQDLSDGVPEDRAVRSFETKVAPANYKRPSSVITKSMVSAAIKTIKELDLEESLQRRHATLEDVSITSVLFVDNSVKSRLKGGVEDLLMEAVKPAKFDACKAEDVSMETFLSDVLPKTSTLSLFVDNNHVSNFVSLTAPAHTNTKSLFKWDNDFAWSYSGEAADSIKDKVKRAGGIVENVAMRVSLAWHNYDDLDLHIVEPDANHIYFRNKSDKLDVDMNAGGRQTREPVENIRWLKKPRDGVYEVFINNWAKRESIDFGFTVEIECADRLETLHFPKAIPNGTNQPVAKIEIKHGTIRNLTNASGITSKVPTREEWGIKTRSLVKVNTVVLSPNYWDENATGNKHWFFLLDGCKNPNPTRGIYNEFLNTKLEKHRKVFEVLGDKTKCPVADKQLSGLGFSSTGKDRVTVVASGKPFNIIF